MVFLNIKVACTLPLRLLLPLQGRILFYYIQFIDGFTGFMKSAGAEKENNPSFQYLMAFEVFHIEKKLSKYQPVQFLYSKEINAFICHIRTVTYKSISSAF